MPNMPWRPINFRAIPNRAFTDDRMETRHFRVLAAILQASDWDTGFATLSLKRLAKLAGRTRRNGLKALGELIDWGYVEKWSGGRRLGGQRKANVYRVNYHDPERLAAMARAKSPLPGDPASAPLEGEPYSVPPKGDQYPYPLNPETPSLLVYPSDDGRGSETPPPPPQDIVRPGPRSTDAPAVRLDRILCAMPHDKMASFKVVAWQDDGRLLNAAEEVMVQAEQDDPDCVVERVHEYVSTILNLARRHRL